MSQTTNAGIVTAYGAAVRGGYQGSYNDFCTDLANLTQVVNELANLSATAETLVAGSAATATYSNGVFSFGIPRGDKGETGDTGNGIESVSLLSTSGLNKTYRITFTDGTHFDYVVADGKSIVSTVLNVDYTLTITYNDGTTWTSESIRGATGATPNLTIGTVITGAAGTPASAEITGTAEDPVLNLTIPKGADGDVSPASLASTYSASQTYAVGDYVWYSGQLYCCTTAITTAEAWTAAHWTAAKIANDVKDLKSSIADATDYALSAYATDTASGAIATFEDGADNVPVKELTVYFEPIQNLNGYDNPWPAGGGKNLADFVDRMGINTSGVVVDQSGRIATVNPIMIEDGVSYVLKTFGSVSSGGFRGICAVYNGTTLVRRVSGITANETIDTSGGDRFYFCVYCSDTTVSITVDSAKAMVVKSTDTVTSYEPYTNICPISGHTMANVYVSPTTDVGDATTYPIIFPSEEGIVYGGHATVNQDGIGTLYITTAGHVFDGTENVIGIGSGDSFLIRYPFAGIRFVSNGRACSHFPNATISTTNTSQGYYAYSASSSSNGLMQFRWGNLFTSDEEFKAWTASQYANGTPLIAICQLETPIVISFTSIQIKSLLGTNYFWADTGNVDVTIHADTDLYVNAITQSIAPIENGTTASKAYAQGEYFFHYSKFCKALTAIASGATFTLNTNYAETTVADELATIINV